MMTPHAALMVRSARRRAGAGWSLLSPDLRAALVAYEAMSIATAQAESTMAANPALANIAESYNQALREIE